MTDYTPEKVTELIAEARDLGDKRRHFWPTPRVMAAVFRRLADALKAVTAERDELRAAIAEALDWRDEAYHGAFGKDEFAQGYGYARRAIGRILRAALDKEG